VSTSRGPRHSLAPRVPSHAAVQAAGVVGPRGRIRRGRCGDRQPGHPDATTGRGEQRSLTADHPVALKPARTLQPTGMRPRHAVPPPHRTCPGFHRCHPDSHQPLQPGKRRRSSPELGHHSALPRNPRTTPSVTSDRCPRPAPVLSALRTAGRSSAAEPDHPNEYVEGGWSGSAAHRATRRNPNGYGRGGGPGYSANPGPSRSGKGVTLRMTAIDNIC
jgi:hypothetical protein